MEEEKSKKQFIFYLILFIIAILFIKYFNVVLKAISTLINVIYPLILGGVIAYILNIVMKKIEKIYFPNSNKSIVKKTRRIASILISILLIVGVGVIIINLIIPELISACSIIGKTIPIYFNKVVDWIVSHSDKFPAIAESFEDLEIDWNNTIKNIVSYATSGVGSILNSTLSFVTIVTSGVVNFVIALIFAIYLLLEKDKLFYQLKNIMRIYLKEKLSNNIRIIFEMAHDTFSNFIIGQVTEAVILGALCTIGMLILQLPYAPMVGALIGATALIPVAGAYIGGAVGAFLILTVNPIKAVLFLVFLVILQQLEGNLIYPKVVGSSIGLPGIWVLTAVTIGGGIGGILGMLLGVPCVATIYKLIQQDIRKKSLKQDAI